MTAVLADLGATNARFVVMKNGKLSDVYQFACDDFKSPIELIQSFVCLYAPEAKYLLCGVPGVVFDGVAKWTNRPWKLDSKAIRQKLKLKEVILMNDLEVQGSALPVLTKKDLVFLRGKKANNGPKILVNIGTGLGSCYIVDGKVHSAEYGQTLATEGYTTEKRISGEGFKQLYQKLADKGTIVSAVKIAEKCLSGDRLATKTYRLFYDDFARILMNLALTIKATGGVYFCGGILDEKTLKQMKFANTFVQHPKMKKLLENMPLIFIKKKDFAFLGLRTLAKKFGWS